METHRNMHLKEPLFKRKVSNLFFGSIPVCVPLQVTSKQYPQMEEGALESSPELKIVLQNPVPY